MKLVIISDTHSLHHKMHHSIPDGDVLIHCGDFTNIGRQTELQDFIDWFDNLPHKYKILIPGNHDKCFDPKFDVTIKSNATGLSLDRYPVAEGAATWTKSIMSKYLSQKDNYFLIDEECIIENIKFWGSPFTPWFHGDYWAFNAHRGDEIKKHWDKIPLDVNVLITHGPPKTDMFLDYTLNDYINVGCEDLRRKLFELKKLQIHCFGHIHEGYGKDGAENDNGIILINASICNLNYSPKNEPFLIEI